MKLLKYCWQNCLLRTALLLAITTVTVALLFCAWVNWSGARQWRAAQELLHAEGESLDPREVVSPPLPDAENFCAIPLLKDLAATEGQDVSKGPGAEKRKRLEALKIPTEGKAGAHPKGASALLGRYADLPAWAHWFREEGGYPVLSDGASPAAKVLAALAKHDPLIQELAAGLDRPGAQWTPAWKTRPLPPLLASIALPHYSNLMGLNQMFGLRAIAAARAGVPAKAHEAALIMARLNQACLEEPFLIGLLVGAGGTNVLHDATWELCDAQAGSAEDFARLEAALSRLDFRKAILHAWRGELAGDVNMVQYIQHSRDDALGSMGLSNDGVATRPNPLTRLMAHAIPSGFFTASCALLVDRELRYAIRPARDEGWPATLAAAQAWENELLAMKKDTWRHPTYIFPAMIAPALTSVIYRSTFAQALVDQAAIACALERTRLATGAYPESLAGITRADGSALPFDVVTSEPVHYHRTADGKYKLWSVGFDRRDDGGERHLDEKHPESTRFQGANYTGDWVWDFPPAPEKGT